MITNNAIASAGIHQHGSAHNIRLQENTGIFNGAVHMTFRGKVHHHVRVLLLEQTADSLSVTDIRLHKAEMRMLHDRSQRGQIARIGELIQADNAILRMVFQHIKNKVASNKSGAAGHNNRHDMILLRFQIEAQYSTSMYLPSRISFRYCPY